MKFSRSGQAAVELTIAIICILVVVAGLIQLVLMITADSETMLEASSAAASRAAGSTPVFDTPVIISAWNKGEDGMEQTKDDRKENGDLYGVRALITGKTVADGDWSATDGSRHDEIRRLHFGEERVPLGMVKGESSRKIEVIPAARAIFGLDEDEVVVNEVWMTTTGNLY